MQKYDSSISFELYLGLLVLKAKYEILMFHPQMKTFLSYEKQKNVREVHLRPRVQLQCENLEIITYTPI